jgi:hypothetical protein
MASLIMAIFALAIALEATGHIVFRGRLIPLHRGRWNGQGGLRHASAETTLGTYGHLWPDRDEPTPRRGGCRHRRPGGTDTEQR